MLHVCVRLPWGDRKPGGESKGKKDTRRTFLCLIGEKGEVLLTFFTDQ